MHRSTLTKDKSVFEGMFALARDATAAESPDGGARAPREGDSDDHPIRLQGDTPDELRALLWALYALYVPTCLEVNHDTHTNSVQTS